MSLSNKPKKSIYMDFASATPIDEAVLLAVTTNFKNFFANPSSLHELGLSAKKILEDGRSQVAQIINAKPEEVIFTSGTTESNNLAIQGVLSRKFPFIPHVVTTNIEHPSVLEICQALLKEGKIEVTYVEADESGQIAPEQIKKAIKANTVLVSVIYANNEIGSIQNIREIARVVRHFRKKGNQRELYFHTDAAQAINYLDINVERLGVDILSFGSSKIYAPRGIGVLYKKKTVKMKSVFYGGGQEFSIRSGTENPALVSGLARALLVVEKIKSKEGERLSRLQKYFFKVFSKLAKKYGRELILNGSLENRLPNNLNFTLVGIPSDLLTIELSAKGIYISQKSACQSGDEKNSYVIEALRRQGNSTKDAGSLRFSFGRSTEKKDLDETIKALDKILEKLNKWYS